MIISSRRRALWVVLVTLFIAVASAASPVDPLHTAAAATCAPAIPVIVPIVVGLEPGSTGSFAWSSTTCGLVSGSWSAAGGHGAFSYTGGVKGQWTTDGKGSGSFDFGCDYCDHMSGTWSNDLYGGGQFQYDCAGCARLSGHWSGYLSDARGTYEWTCDTCTAVRGSWSAPDTRGSFSGTDGTSGYWNSNMAPAAVIPSPTPSAAPVTAKCTSFIGAGIAPPQNVAMGISGYHAAWYGQSGYPVLCPGDRTVMTIAYLNTGSLGWVIGVPGQTALLGTWDPDPGQDRPSPLGGDGSFGSPTTRWATYDRPAIQSSAYVGPGQVAWFQFTIQAPTTPGTYLLALRPVLEGTQWLEEPVYLYAAVRGS